MSTKPTIVLVLLAGVLAIAAWVMLRPKQTPPTDAQRLMQLEPESVDALQIVWQDGLVFEAERDMSSGVPGWVQTQVVSHPLLRTSIDEIVVAICSLQSHEAVGIDESDFAAIPPTATVTINGTDTVELGRQTVAGRALVRIGEENVAHIVDDDLHRLLTTDPVAWRKRSVFDSMSVDVSRIRIALASGESTELQRLPGGWRLTHPVSAVADRAVVNQLLAALIDGRINAFIADKPEELSRFGLDNPVMTLTATTVRRSFDSQSELQSDTDEQELSIGSATDVSGSTLYAKRKKRDVVVSIDRSLVELMALSPRQLIAKEAFTEQAEDIASIEMTLGNRLTLSRSLQGWTLEADSAADDIDPTAAADDILGFLSTQQSIAIELAEAAPGDATMPEANLIVRGHDGGDLARYRLIDAADGDLDLVDTANGVIRRYDVRPRFYQVLK